MAIKVSIHSWWKYRVEHSGDRSDRSSSSLQVLIHVIACIASLALGLKIAEEALFSYSSYQTPMLVSSPVQNIIIENHTVVPRKSSSVHPGRHQILIRAWPHPDPLELAAAQAIIERVQLEQRRLSDANHRKQDIIVVTTVLCPKWPYHLDALANTLSSVRAPSVTWVVVGHNDFDVEALHEDPTRCFHVKSDNRDEFKLRMDGLRFVKENKMKGVIVFVDEFATPGVDLFDEIQKVKWVGAFAVGYIVNSPQEQDTSLFIQRPVCDRSLNETSIQHGLLNGTQFVRVYQQELDWSGLAFNAELLWSERPSWISSWDKWSENVSVSAFIKDLSMVETLGNCGEDVLLWSLHTRSCPDTSSIHRGVIYPPLQVVVPWKRTPWQEASNTFQAYNTHSGDSSVKLMVNSSKPVTSLDTAVANLGKPMEILDKPMANLGKPMEILDKPVVNLGKPVTNLGKPQAESVKFQQLSSQGLDKPKKKRKRRKKKVQNKIAGAIS